MAAVLRPSKITEEEWDRYKDIIVSLYLGIGPKECERVQDGESQLKGQTLDELAESMRVVHGFTASVSQFEARLKKWNARKNLKPEEWQPILERLDVLPRATKSRIVISGRVVPNTTISRARRYRKEKSRAIKNASALGPSNVSTLPQQAHIEVQEPDGRWVQLSPTASTPLPRVSPPLVLEANALEPSSPNSFLATPTGLSLSDGYNYPWFDTNSSCRSSSLDGGRPISIQLSLPSTWLQQLPSRRLINTMLIKGVNGINQNRHRTHVQDLFKIITVGLDRVTPHSALDNRNPRGPNTTVTSEDFRSPIRGNQSIMTPDDLCRSNFNQFLLSAIVNGLSSLETIPEAVLDGCLGPDHLLSSVLLSCFYTIPKHAATTLASSFFQASIIQGKHDIVAQLLEKRLAVANDNVIFIQGMRRITPFEWAAMQKDEILLELLLSYGADPNKTYCQGEGTIKRYDRALLKLIGPSYYGGSITYGPSAAAVRKLFEAGAEVCPGIGPSLKHVDEAVASCIISQILPSQHADFFPNEFWTSVILCGGDIQAADLVNQVVLDCRERHNGQCLLRFQEQVDWGLVAAASKGRVDTFLAISPHSSHSSSLDATLLSASIRGKQPAIIDFVMLRKPDINPRPHTLQPHNPYKPHNPLMGVADDETSPLAETIRTGNTEFVDLFTQANIFESLHEGGRLEVALSAAVETGNAELVVRMLGSCPDLESLSIKHILDQAIDNGQEGLALVLIGRGASVYSGRRFGTIMPYSIPPVLRAIENGNLLIARKLVEIGDMGEYYRDNSRALQVLCRRQGCSIDPLLTKDFLSSFDCNFRYEVDDIRADCLRSYLSQSAEETAQQFPETISAALIEEGLDLILTSKLATVPLLTVCLASAISQNNATLARELIKRGADAADEMVWTCAVRWNPDLLPLLLDGMNHQRSVIPTGLRTEVLKRAIMQGPSRADVVSLLITSGSVDIFDTGDGNGLERSTPLGVAIRKTELFPKFGYDIVRLLLEHGCDPNGIVRFNTNNAGNAPNTNQTAILEAISVGNQELVELLIEYGAHVNTEMRHLVRRTPLQKAAEEGDLEMVQLLLSHKADVSAEPCIALGGTALQFAAISGNCNIAAELLSHGALLHMPPSSIGGRWPIEGAAEHGRVDMIQFLWTANEETLFLYDGDTGFQEKNFKKAMRLAGENGHIGCRDLIAELANLPITATDVPPVVSPMYISWPPLK